MPLFTTVILTHHCKKNTYIIVITLWFCSIQMSEKVMIVWQWASLHNNNTLKWNYFNWIQPSSILLFTPVLQDVKKTHCSNHQHFIAAVLQCIVQMNHRFTQKKATLAVKTYIARKSQEKMCKDLAWSLIYYFNFMMYEVNLTGALTGDCLKIRESFLWNPSCLHQLL